MTTSTTSATTSVPASRAGRRIRQLPPGSVHVGCAQPEQQLARDRPVSLPPHVDRTGRRPPVRAGSRVLPGPLRDRSRRHVPHGDRRGLLAGPPTRSRQKPRLHVLHPRDRAGPAGHRPAALAVGHAAWSGTPVSSVDAACSHPLRPTARSPWPTSVPVTGWLARARPRHSASSCPCLLYTSPSPRDGLLS